MTPELRRPARGRARLVALASALALSLALAFAFRTPGSGGMPGSSTRGLVYRSAQPVGGLADLAKARKLATVLNLRGGGDSDPWYAAEVAASRELGLDFYDLPSRPRPDPRAGSC